MVSLFSRGMHPTLHTYPLAILGSGDELFNRNTFGGGQAGGSQGLPPRLSHNGSKGARRGDARDPEDISREGAWLDPGVHKHSSGCVLDKKLSVPGRVSGRDHALNLHRLMLLGLFLREGEDLLCLGEGPGRSG